MNEDLLIDKSRQITEFIDSDRFKELAENSPEQLREELLTLIEDNLKDISGYETIVSFISDLDFSNGITPQELYMLMSNNSNFTAEAEFVVNKLIDSHLESNYGSTEEDETVESDDEINDPLVNNQDDIESTPNEEDIDDPDADDLESLLLDEDSDYKGEIDNAINPDGEEKSDEDDLESLLLGENDDDDEINSLLDLGSDDEEEDLESLLSGNDEDDELNSLLLGDDDDEEEDLESLLSSNNDDPELDSLLQDDNSDEVEDIETLLDEGSEVDEELNSLLDENDGSDDIESLLSENNNDADDEINKVLAGEDVLNDTTGDVEFDSLVDSTPDEDDFEDVLGEADEDDSEDLDISIDDELDDVEFDSLVDSTTVEPADSSEDEINSDDLDIGEDDSQFEDLDIEEDEILTAPVEVDEEADVEDSSDQLDLDGEVDELDLFVDSEDDFDLSESLDASLTDDDLGFFDDEQSSTSLSDDESILGDDFDDLSNAIESLDDGEERLNSILGVEDDVEPSTDFFDDIKLDNEGDDFSFGDDDNDVIGLTEDEDEEFERTGLFEDDQNGDDALNREDEISFEDDDENDIFQDEESLKDDIFGDDEEDDSDYNYSDEDEDDDEDYEVPSSSSASDDEVDSGKGSKKKILAGAIAAVVLGAGGFFAYNEIMSDDYDDDYSDVGDSFSNDMFDDIKPPVQAKSKTPPTANTQPTVSNNNSNFDVREPAVERSSKSDDELRKEIRQEVQNDIKSMDSKFATLENKLRAVERENSTLKQILNSATRENRDLIRNEINQIKVQLEDEVFKNEILEKIEIDKKHQKETMIQLLNVSKKLKVEIEELKDAKAEKEELLDTVTLISLSFDEIDSVKEAINVFNKSQIELAEKSPFANTIDILEVNAIELDFDDTNESTSISYENDNVLKVETTAPVAEKPVVKKQAPAVQPKVSKPKAVPAVHKAPAKPTPNTKAIVNDVKKEVKKVEVVNNTKSNQIFKLDRDSADNVINGRDSLKERENRRKTARELLEERYNKRNQQYASQKAAQVQQVEQAQSSNSVTIASVDFSKYSYQLAGVIDGSAYLKNKVGSMNIYKAGDILPGYGEIFSVNNDGTILTSKGLYSFDQIGK